MEKFIKNFEGNSIKMAISNDNDIMLNVIDVAKIMEINPFQWLETDENKEFIASLGNNSKTYIEIESSDEIYIHNMIFCKLTFLKHMPLYEWFFTRSFMKV